MESLCMCTFSPCKHRSNPSCPYYKTTYSESSPDPTGMNANLSLTGGFGFKIWGFPKIRCTLLGGPHNKEYSILGSRLGSPYFGKEPFGSRGSNDFQFFVP